MAFGLRTCLYSVLFKRSNKLPGARLECERIACGRSGAIQVREYENAAREVVDIGKVGVSQGRAGRRRVRSAPLARI